MTEMPMVAMVKRPTHFELATAPRLRPVSERSDHQRSEKGARFSSLQKATQK